MQLQDLFRELQADWKLLDTQTKTWLAELERKYSKGSNAFVKAAREAISNQSFFLNSMEQQVQKVDPATASNTEMRDEATRLQNYLDSTQPLQQVLTERSNGDKNATEQANKVQAARDALSKQIDAIYKITSTNVLSSTLPSSTPLPTNITALASTAGSVSSGGPAGPAGSGSTPPQPPLIIQLLKANNSAYIQQTQALLDDKTPNPPLQNQDIDPLIKAWRDAVDTFTNNFPPGLSLQLGMLIGLTILHSQLEVLYDQLINIEEGTRVSAATLLSIR